MPQFNQPTFYSSVIDNTESIKSKMCIHVHAVGSCIIHVHVHVPAYTFYSYLLFNILTKGIFFFLNKDLEWFQHPCIGCSMAQLYILLPEFIVQFVLVCRAYRCTCVIMYIVVHYSMYIVASREGQTRRTGRGQAGSGAGWGAYQRMVNTSDEILQCKFTVIPHRNIACEDVHTSLNIIVMSKFLLQL